MSCTGCDGVYTSTADGNGNVIVVNRFTGDARRIHGDIVSEVKPPSASAPSAANQGAVNHAPTLYPQVIFTQPLEVHAMTRFREDKMFVRVSIEPKTKLTDPEWETWRAHVSALQHGNAAISLQFTDNAGFNIANERVPLSSMIQEIGLDNKLANLDQQFSLPMTQATYDAIDGWNVTWDGYWPTYAPPPAK